MSRREKNAAATREAMLSSARKRFLQESYENASLRDIAGDAGVDVALVSRYFGSKEALFREVMRGDPAEWADLTVAPEAVPRWLAGLATREHSSDNVEDIERLLIILRSASSPKAARIVRDSLREDCLDPIAKLAGTGGDRETKASLALSLLIGLTVLRTIMEVDALSTCDPQPFAVRIERMFEAALADAA
jgi:AcrR family transcriptional regulator